MALHEQNGILKKSSDAIAASNYETRLETLEREVNKDKQYFRRDSLEIAGIDREVGDDEIENECLRILKTAKVKVGNRFPSTLDVHAAHRIGRKGNVIIKFVNRKWAETSLVKASSLKQTEGYENIYVNASLCPEYKYLNFAVRQAKRNNEIHYYKVKNGMNYIQKRENGPQIEISHVNDLELNELSVPVRLY